MKAIWFKKWGWVYRPVSIVGWVLLGITIFLIGQVFVAVDRGSHSTSDTLIGVFPWAWMLTASLLWTASKTSSE